MDLRVDLRVEQTAKLGAEQIVKLSAELSVQLSAEQSADTELVISSYSHERSIYEF